MFGFGKHRPTPEREQLEIEREKTRIKRGQLATKVVEYERLERLMSRMLSERAHDAS